MKKVNLKYIALSFIAVAAFSLQSCSSDESYDVVGNPNNLFYIKANSSASSPNTLSYQVVHTPVGDFGEFSAQYPVLCTKPSSGNATVKAEIDNSLIDAYNAKYGTSYKQFPAGTLDVSKMNVTMQKDSCKGKDSITVSVSKDNLAKLTESAYIAPIRITSVEGAKGLGSQDYGIAYLVVTTSTKLIKANAGSSDISGTLITDYSAWTGSSDTGDSSFSNMFTANDRSGWGFSTSPSTFVIDMKEVKNLSAFRIMPLYGNYGYALNYITVAVSTDGNTYTDCGTSTSSETANESGYQYVVFYGALPCRYLKLTVDWSTSSWGSYYDKIVHFGAYVKQQD